MNPTRQTGAAPRFWAAGGLPSSVRPARGPSSPTSSILLLIAGIFLAVFFGLAAAVLPAYFVVMLSGMVLVPVLLLAWLAGRTTESRDWLLLLMFAGILVLPFGWRLTGINLGPVWQIALMAVSFLGLRRFWAEVEASIWLKLAVLAFVLFFVMAIASTMLGQPKWRAVAYQVVSNFKPILLVAFGFALMWDDRCERWLSLLLSWAWLPMALMVVFEWVAPGPFHAIGVSAVGMLATSDPTLFLPSRAISIFEHPSQLAAVSASFAMIAYARWLCSAARTSRQLALVFIYVVLIICAVQRQELASVMIGLAVIWALFDPKLRGRKIVLLSIATVCVVLVAVVAAPAMLEDELFKWGIGKIGPIDAPRAQIFIGGFQLASMHFPFGAGLGTFAGAGAEKFNFAVYDQLGFGRYWWFGKRGYLLDTYWPNSLGEAGVFGALFLLLFYLCLLGFAVAMARRLVSAQSHAFALAASGSMIYILLVSLTSPAFQDPRLFAIPAMLLGISAHLAKQHAHVEET